MTIKELSQLYWLNKEIERDKTRLAELYAKATGTSQAITGMPHAPGITDKVGKYATEIADLQKEIERHVVACEQEKVVLEAYINGIPDSLTRQIFHLRFVGGESWEGVADAVGGNNSPGGVKQRVFRFIKSSPNVTQ